MVELIDPVNFDFFAKYLLAGLIIIWARSAFVIGERPRLAEMVVEAVILSLVNQLLFQAIIWLLSLVFTSLPTGRLVFFAEVLVLPAVLGIAFGLSLSRGWNRALLRRLSMPVQGPRQRAYDHASRSMPPRALSLSVTMTVPAFTATMGKIPLPQTIPHVAIFTLNVYMMCRTTVSGQRKVRRAVSFSLSPG